MQIICMNTEFRKNFDRKLTKPVNTFVLLPVYQPLLYSLIQTIEIIFRNSEWKTER